MGFEPTDSPRSEDAAVDETTGDVGPGDRTEDADGEEMPVEALHRVELGLEWFQRAHGHLMAFHHNTGHAMDHFAAAEELLREADEDDLADELRDEVLPCGVLGDRWSYDVLERFQNGLLADAEAFEEDARQQISDGQRHVAERRQRREWRDRARE